MVQNLKTDEHKQQTAGRLKTFLPPSEQAMFHWSPLAGALLPERRVEARSWARQALAVYGLDGEPGSAGQGIEGLQQDRPFLDPEPFARLTEDCYGLLLIWAEFEAEEGAGQARQRGERALALLERAAQVGQACGLNTQAYYIHKARYLALSRGEPARAVGVPALAGLPGAQDRLKPELQRDAPKQPTGALDWFLKGLESYRAGRFAEAGQAAREALRLQDDHFWARYLEALCLMRAGRWLEARAELTTCVNQRPDFPLPLIIRGFAASERGAWYAQQEVNASRSRSGDAENARDRYRKEKETLFDLARADFDKALSQKLDEQTHYLALTNRGVLFVRQSLWAKAIADLKQAVQVLPGRFQAYADLAQALQGAGQGSEAVTVLSQAIARLPDKPGFADFRVNLYGARAKLHWDQKEWRSARDDYERAIACEPKDGQSTTRLAENLVRSGQACAREGRHREALSR